MKRLIFFFLLFSLNSKADCLKKITVEVYKVRSNPNPFQKIKEADKKVFESTKEISVDCDVFKDIEVGDLLEPKNETVSRFRLFHKDKGYLEKTEYKVISK